MRWPAALRWLRPSGEDLVGVELKAAEARRVWGVAVEDCRRAEEGLTTPRTDRYWSHERGLVEAMKMAMKSPGSSANAVPLVLELSPAEADAVARAGVLVVPEEIVWPA